MESKLLSGHMIFSGLISLIHSTSNKNTLQKCQFLKKDYKQSTHLELAANQSECGLCVLS